MSIGTQHPLKFLAGGRSLESVMSRNNKLWAEFQKRYEARFTKVYEYYEHRKSSVRIIDITKIVPPFANGLGFEGTEEDE